ncbi:hypothetical protein AQUCO_00900462v1 [Aquilegia coerulea]|uniref:Uncharacterized protein n=1 Tax=Aquilegia coerulea TaxID=218851 RepID=A0A2G5EDS5_AQUCA|nr:hypothetical protein AQUCO_00900462v1 [Aquilegia coerulea]
MGSECNPRKPRYDLSMSKRTRKPSRFVEIDHHQKCIEVDNSDVRETTVSTNILNEKAVMDHTSLKELIINDEEEVNGINADATEQMIAKHEEVTSEKEGKGGISLGHHFTVTEEEKQLQIVTVQHRGNVEGVKLSKMLSRYMKVFTHVIKLKKDRRFVSSRKNPVLHFAM